MYKDYNIGTIAKLLGISSESLRYYESKKVIQPRRDPETGYRYYTAWDLHLLIQAKHYQSYGYTLKEIVKLFQAQEPTQISEELKCKETAIEHEILLQMNRLNCIRQNQAMLNDAAQSISPDFEFGMGLNEEYAAFLDITEGEYVQYHPPRMCLHTCVPSSSGHYLTPEFLSPAFEYMKKNGLKLSGDIITQVVCMTRAENEYHNLHIVWIPI